MKTFEDLNWEENLNDLNKKQGLMFFNNGYGVSVIQGDGTLSRGDDKYELEVLKGNSNSWSIIFDKKLVYDVMGCLSRKEVIRIMSHVQEL